jgi:hypothetical protein
MKHTLILLSIFLTTGPSMASDPVDELTANYERLERDGLLSLHIRHLEELAEVRERAMANRNLVLANREERKRCVDDSDKVGETNEKTGCET